MSEQCFANAWTTFNQLVNGANNSPTTHNSELYN